jgi:glycosyltransferase involved in cell wall biosynthesis
MAQPRMKEARGLLIGPFPPPIGGDTVVTSNLFRSRYWREHGLTLERIDSSAHAGVRVPDERLSGRDVLRGVRVCVEVLVRLRHVDFVLLWGNTRFIVTAGIPIVLAGVAWRKPVLVKPFGASLAKRIGRSTFAWRPAVLWALRKSTYVLPETQLLARELVDGLGLPKDRVLRLPNFLQDAFFPETFSERSYTGRCVFIGQVKKEKGIFDIVDALRGRADVNCDFYGPILERDREAFLAEISKSENLRYRGVLEPARVLGALRSYDVLLLPTYHSGEGYPAVIMEAFAAGIPVVASRWLSIPELIEDGIQGLLIPPQAPHRLREALGRLAADARLYETLSRNAFEHAKSFSEKAVLEDVLIAHVEEALRRGK